MDSKRIVFSWSNYYGTLLQLVICILHLLVTCDSHCMNLCRYEREWEDWESIIDEIQWQEWQYNVQRLCCLLRQT